MTERNADIPLFICYSRCSTCTKARRSTFFIWSKSL